MSALSSGNDTIAAIATAPGAGGIGVVRISGPGALAVAEQIFRGRGGRSLAGTPGSRMILGAVSDPATGSVIDEVLAVRMPAGRSYTGEPTVEFHGHGGPLVLQSLLLSVLACGARRAGPGEFTRRAFLSGRIDLTQAEAVCALIGAEDDAERRNAILQLRGAAKESVAPLRERLLELVARVEAALDLEDEDEPMAIPERSELASLAADIRVFAGSSLGHPKPSSGARVALAGRPNSGKSSIFNYLLDFERSIVSSVPGTTRDYVEERSILGGAVVTLVDTAGFRETDDVVEAEGVRRSIRQVAEADVAVLVFDGSEENHADDLELLGLALDRSPIIVVSKADLELRFNAGHLGPQATDLPVYRISVRTGFGLQEFTEELGRRCHAAAGAGADSYNVLNARHHEALRKAAAFIESASDLAATSPMPLDLVAVELRAALGACGEVTGETATEEILDRIFSRFCVGK